MHQKYKQKWNPWASQNQDKVVSSGERLLRSVRCGEFHKAFTLYFLWAGFWTPRLSLSLAAAALASRKGIDNCATEFSRVAVIIKFLSFILQTCNATLSFPRVSIKIVYIRVMEEKNTDGIPLEFPIRCYTTPVTLWPRISQYHELLAIIPTDDLLGMWTVYSRKKCSMKCYVFCITLLCYASLPIMMSIDGNIQWRIL